MAVRVMQNYIQDGLMDIREVLSEIESEKCDTQAEKIDLFLQKIKNPYEYRVGPVKVNISFSDNTTIDDCFANFLKTM